MILKTYIVFCPYYTHSYVDWQGTARNISADLWDDFTKSYKIMTYKANFVKPYKDCIDILCNFSGTATKKTKSSTKIARFLKYCSKKYLFLCPKTGYDDTVKKDRVLQRRPL